MCQAKIAMRATWPIRRLAIAVALYAWLGVPFAHAEPANPFQWIENKPLSETWLNAGSPEP